MISQLTVFLENEKGRLAAATRAVADAGVNMHALYLADTEDFGVARMLCDTPNKAAEKLTLAGWRAAVTPVMAVRVPDVPGGVASLLEFLHVGRGRARHRRIEGIWRRGNRAQARRCRLRARFRGGCVHCRLASRCIVG